VPDTDPPAATRRVLTAAGGALARTERLDDGLLAMLDALTAATGADGGIIAVADPDGSGLNVAAAIGVDEATTGALVAAAGDADHPLSRALARREMTDDGASIYAPLVVVREGAQLGLGVLALDGPAGGGFGPAERELIAAAADLAAAAIDRARVASLALERSEWSERLAHADPLTGLANSRTFHRVLELELARAARQRGEVSVALFDVDGFGRTVEEVGGGAGDDILREVAAVLNESIRLVDTVARLDADEFALVAPGGAGTTVARRVLDGIGRVPGLAARSVTVSVGVAHFPADGTTSDQLLTSAAQALGSAKAGGPARIAEATAGG